MQSDLAHRKLPQHEVVCWPDSDQRSKEAEQLLARSFDAKQHRPAMFALLCDELTDAVTSGRLAEPIRAWLSLAATEELETFLEDCSHDLPAVQVSIQP